MPLPADLIQLAQQKLLAAQAANFRPVVRQQLLDLVAMRPAGLASAQWMGIDLNDFAAIIDANRAQLRPWVMVYAAATGLMGPWMTVRSVWTRLDPPANNAIHQTVSDTLDSLFTGYVNWITN